MKTKKVEVRTYITKCYCEKCGAEMKMLPYVLCTAPPMYPYECPECGHRENSFKNSGELEYEEIPIS